MTYIRFSETRQGRKRWLSMWALANKYKFLSPQGHSFQEQEMAYFKTQSHGQASCLRMAAGVGDWKVEETHWGWWGLLNMEWQRGRPGDISISLAEESEICPE